MAKNKSMSTSEGMAHEYMVSWFRGCSFSATKSEKQTLTRIFQCAYHDGFSNFLPKSREPSECSKAFARTYRLHFVWSGGKITKHEGDTLDGFLQACYKQGQTRAYIERLEALCGVPSKGGNQ